MICKNMNSRKNWKGRLRTFSCFLLFLSFPRCTFSISTDSLANLESLQLVQIFFRHGDRSPLSTFPKNPVNLTEKFPAGLGQLSRRGKAQACELGEFIRKRYRHFIRPEFQSGEVIAKSSTISRALQTGIGVLGGLYDVKNRGHNDLYFVQTVPTEQDNFIAFSADCPRYEEEHSLYHTHRDGRHILQQNKEFIMYLSEQTGIPEHLMNFWKMAAIYDTLLVQRLYGYPHPEWATKSFKGGTDTHILKRMAEIAFATITYSPTTMRLRGGPVLDEILRNIETLKEDRDASAAQENTIPVPTKMYLYAGHDSTISALLQALGVFEAHMVPYTAAVFVELHKRGSAGGIPEGSCPAENAALGTSEDYYLRVFYRNCTQSPPKELLIPQCSTESGGCPLSTFYSLKQELLHVNFKYECYQCNGGFFSFDSIKSLVTSCY